MKQRELNDPFALDDYTAFFQSLIQNSYRGIGFRAGVRCENRPMDTLNEGDSIEGKSDEKGREQPLLPKESSLKTLYDIIIY